MANKDNILFFSIFISMAIGFMLVSCEKETSWNISGNSNIKLVVEGYVTSEKKVQMVKLTLPVQSLNELPKPASGAVITISDSTTTWSLHEKPLNSGIYYSDSVFRGISGITYTLNITYGGFTSSASSYMVATSPLEKLDIAKVKDSAGFYQYHYIKSNEPSMLEVFLDWSYLTGYQNFDSTQRIAELIYYNLNTIDVNEIFKPDQENFYFPAGTMIKRRKYSLNPDEQKFIRSLLLETEWRSGRFDVQPDNVYSNLSAGAAGYFGAYMVVSDSTVFR